MGLQNELGFPYPIEHAAHEAVLNVVVTGEMLAKEAGRLLRPFGLTQAQYNVLSLLQHQSDGGSLNQTRLGRMLVVNRSNVTGLVDRMEEAGWVRRTEKLGDRRVNEVKMTAAGRRIQEQAERAYHARLAEVMQDLPEAACGRLCRTLENMRARLCNE